ncbi:MAG: outer membrane protein transport protein, partial [Actinobacteria bacterium]|nr:outer membrane protein transport protein [Actinomycetota bacterium]
GTYPDHRDANGDPWSFNGAEYPEVCESEGLFRSPNPLVAVSTEIGKRLPVVAIGLHAPMSNERLAYPEAVTLSDGTLAPGPQRYDLVSRRLVVLFPTVAAAYSVLPWIRVGAAFQASYASLSFANVVSAAVSDNPRNDFLTSLDTVDPFTPVGILAAQARIHRFDVGVNARFPGDFHADGDVTFTRTRFTDPTYAEPRSDAVVHAPQNPTVRFGARYFHPRAGADAAWADWDPLEHEIFDVEADVVWEGNSAFDSLDIEVKEDVLDFGPSEVPVVDPRVAHGWRDTTSFRLGGDLNALPGRLAVRAGFSYEEGASPLELSKLDFPAYRRVGLFAGATLRLLRRLDLSVGGGHLFGSSRDVGEESGQTYPIGPNGPIESLPMTGGHYELGMTVVAAGASYRFG